MTDEETKQSPEKKNGETLPDSRIKKEEEDDDDEDLFESGDDNVTTKEKEEEANDKEKSSSTSEHPSLLSAPAVASPVQSIADVPIPLKSTTRTAPALLPTSSPQNTTTSTTVLLDPASFDLPPDVKIPKSVSGSLLRQGKLLEILKTLPANLINDALVEYDDAVDVKGENIRNHGAYLYGVVKRYQSVVTRAQNTGNVEILPMGNHITPAVHNRLELLVTTGFCTREEMDEKVRSKIRMLSERDALLALDELSSVDRLSIRNFGSYFMGILNRYMRGEQASSSSKMPPAASRGRDQRSYRDGGDPSYSRERSRDRLDGSKYGRYDSVQHQHPGLPYDDRRSRHLPPPPPPASYGGSMMQPPPHNMQQGMYPNQQQHPIHPINQPGMSMDNNRMPQSAYGMNPINSSMMNEAMPPYGAYMPQESQMPPPYAQQYAQQAPPPPPQQQQQQQQHSVHMHSQQYGVQTMPPNYGTNNMGGWQQQQPSVQTTQGVDIFGLADKAASVVQALANQNGMQQQQQQQGMAFAPNMQSYGMQPQVGGPYNAGLSQQPPPQQHAYPSPMGAVQHLPHTSSGQPPLRSGRRTTATLNQLSPSVQYLVQSIQNSRAVEGPLDDGILGMIHDLPESMAVAALQRFVSIDKTTMRNKTAYLAGILRRELETIKKR